MRTLEFGLFRLIWVLLVFLLMLAPACGSEEKPDSGKKQSEASPVTVEKVEAADFREIASGIGSLASPERVEITPEIDAILDEVHVEEGRPVEKGELLYTLDSDTLQRELHAAEAELASARAELENARVTFRRFESLYESRTISRDEFDTRQTAYLTAQAEVERLDARVKLIQERLEDTIIRAPMAGVIAVHMADPGDFVQAGETLTTLYRMDPLEIEFFIAGDHMGRVEPGQRVEVRLSEQDAPPHAGEVTYVSPSLDRATRKFLVKARVDNADGGLKPGAFASVELVLDLRESRPAVPERALVSQRGGYVVFVVQDGKTVSRDVEIGLRMPGLVEILSGVETGERVVVEGQMRLRDGAKVSVQNEGGGGAP